MTSTLTFKKAGFALAALLAAASSLQAVADVPLPREHTQGAISWVSGGVSQDEAQRFEAAAHRYPLVVKLFEHAGPRDEFTADARVLLTDAKGTVLLDRKADGPFMLLRLPAGHYRVSATLNGRALPQRAIDVSGHGHTEAVFEFPAGT